MARKKEALKYQINNNLRGKISFGKSKHADKQELGFGESNYKIYSYSTYNTYLKECEQYSRWLTETKGIDKFTKLQDTERYAQEYIQYRLNSGVSVYTAKMERSALGMLYGKRIEIDMPLRDNKNIVRSRKEVENDRHYAQNGKYKDVFTMSLATGCRRCDLKNLRTDCLVEKDGHLYVKIFGSKGGRDRLAYVREEYEDEVRNIIQARKEQGQVKVFDKIPQKIDVHSLRREYAKGLYQEIKGNRELRDDILKNYPVRREYKTQRDKDGNSITKEIKSNVYRDREGHVFERDDIYCISQSLGHNRIDCSICHYVR